MAALSPERDLEGKNTGIAKGNFSNGRLSRPWKLPLAISVSTLSKEHFDLLLSNSLAETPPARQMDLVSG